MASNYGQRGKNPKLPKVGGHFEDEQDDFNLDPIDDFDGKYKNHDENFKFDEARNGLRGTLSKKGSRSNKIAIKEIENVLLLKSIDEFIDEVSDKSQQGNNKSENNNTVTSKNQVGFAKFALKGFKAAEFIKSKLSIKNKDKAAPESNKSESDTTTP